MSSAVEVNSAAEVVNDSDAVLDDAMAEDDMLADESIENGEEPEEDPQTPTVDKKPGEETIDLSDSENDASLLNRSKSDEDEEDDEGDVITITANDGSLGQGFLTSGILPSKKPTAMSNQAIDNDEDDDDVVELLDDDDEEEDDNSNNNIRRQALHNGQDEDDLLADDSSLDNQQNFNDSSLSNNDVIMGGKKAAVDEDDVLLISDDDEGNSNSRVSSLTKNSNSSSSSTQFIRRVNNNKNNVRSQDQDDVMVVEESDPLGVSFDDGASGDDESSQDIPRSNLKVQHIRQPMENGVDSLRNHNSSNNSIIRSDSKSNNNNNNHTIVVNNTKSLADLAKKDPGTTEPTLVIIDTNSILQGRGGLPMNNNRNSSSGHHQQRQMNNASKGSGNYSSSGNSSSSIDIPDDAYLIEAPSFIVPYVFEQSGEKSIKDCMKDLADKVKTEREAKIAKGEELTPEDTIHEAKKITSEDYFDSPVGKLLMNIGMNMVQEYVQVDLLKMQKRQGEKEKAKSRMNMMTHLTQQSILSLKKNIDESKENNEPFRSKNKKCELCNFRTESELVMSTHKETPHMKNYSYRCNYCAYTTRVPQEIIFHMEAEHTVKARLERAPAYHQCPNCPFEDNSKAKLTRHLLGCTKRFNISSNLLPPNDWDTPAKLPKLPKNRMLPQGINPAFLVPGYNSMLSKHMPQQQQMMKGGNLPPLLQAPNKNKPIPGLIRANNNQRIQNPVMNSQMQRAMMMRGGSGQMQQQQQSRMQMNSNQMLQQVVSGQLLGIQGAASGFLTKLGLQPQAPVQNASVQKNASQIMRGGNAKTGNQPSISITPLPRQAAASSSSSVAAQQQKPGAGAAAGGKTSFVICEICDGYIKDLDQLRNHMQWIHKVKIHPKMIYNKPPLNCQKCQFRFFTDQGLERHLLGSHGLVTSSMQDAANKGQDSGRCPLCGKVYQWKLLAHVAKDHNVTLKPAHLSYKCTVCTATFGMYKLFESHVYSAHSVTKNAPRPERRPVGGSPQQQQQLQQASGGRQMSQLQVTPRTMPANSSSGNYKPLKINDEITIIPQPMANNAALRNRSLTITPQPMQQRRNIRTNDDDGIQIIEIDDAPHKNGGRPNGDFKSRFAMSETLRKRNLEISLCGTDSDNSDDSRGPTKRLRQN